ncbi:TPA: hypothetical protein ACPG1Q_000154 [Haemophilus influenzae 10810]
MSNNPEENLFPIYFLFKINVDSILFNPHKPEGLSFRLNDSLWFSLNPSKPDEDAQGYSHGLISQIIAKYEVHQEQYDFIINYIRDKRVTTTSSTITLPLYSNVDPNKCVIDDKGYCQKGFSLKRFMCPDDIQELINSAETELYNKMNDLLGLITWNHGIHVNASFDKGTLYWGEKGKDNFFIVPRNLNQQEFPVFLSNDITWEEQDGKVLSESWGKNLKIPLGHILAREATVLIEHYPGSAILMMTSALETGIKTHISKLSPDTEWLLENLPSPPIDKIFKNYIPLLYEKCGRAIEFQKELKSLTKQIKDIIEVRNKIAHTGKLPENIGNIYEMLQFVFDILYLLDVLNGNQWAKELVSSKLMRKLSWKSNKEKIYVSEIREDY